VKLKGHHVYGVGVLTGLGIASYRVWLVIALAFLGGCLATYVVLRGRALIQWTNEQLRIWKAERGARQRERLAQLRESRRGPGRLPRGY
jgi:hypothetical protein